MLTKKEAELFNKLSEEEYKSLVMKEARRRLKGKDLCTTNVSKISKDMGFESAVTMLVDNSYGWI